MRGFAQSIATIAGRSALGVLPAVLLGAYASRPALAFLPYVALIPRVFLYTDDRRPKTSFVYYFLGVWLTWILNFSFTFKYGWHVPIAAALFFIPPWLFFAPVLRHVHRRFHWPRALTVPLIWVAVEWLRAVFTLAHLDFFRLGYSQARFTPLIQIAEITGVYGVSFLIAAVNGLAVDVYLAVRDARWSLEQVRRRGRLLATVGAVGAAFALAWVYGEFRLRRVRMDEGPRLAVVQPNVMHTVRNLVGVHLTQFLMTDERIPAGAADMIVWPENAILDDIRREGVYLDDLSWLASEKDSLMLVGALSHPDEHPGYTSNGAFLVDERGDILGEYHKLLLIPWAEYIPLDGLLHTVSPWLQRLHRDLARKGWGYLATGTAGDGMTVFRVPHEGDMPPFAALICHENSHPPIPAEAARQGARFFVNITSEGESHGPLQEQLMRISMVRAVENRIAYVRAGNTGISCFIDPAGRLQSILRGDRGRTILDAGVLIDNVALSSGGITPYAASHDAFAKLCVVVSFVLWGASLIGRRGPRNPTEARSSP